MYIRFHDYMYVKYFFIKTKLQTHFENPIILSIFIIYYFIGYVKFIRI